jgi:hypothetical protein
MRRAGDARRCSCRIVALRAAAGDGKLRRAKKFKMLQRSEPVITCHSGDGLTATAAVPAMSVSFSLLKPGDTNRANDSPFTRPGMPPRSAMIFAVTNAVRPWLCCFRLQ